MIFTNGKLLFTQISSFRDAFENKEDSLSETLDVSNRVLRLLSDRGVLGHEKITQLRTAPNNYEKVDMLIRLLRLCDRRFFPVFCDILAADGQLHVVDMLLKRGTQQWGKLERYISWRLLFWYSRKPDMQLEKANDSSFYSSCVQSNGQRQFAFTLLCRVSLSLRLSVFCLNLRENHWHSNIVNIDLVA